MYAVIAQLRQKQPEQSLAPLLQTVRDPNAKSEVRQWTVKVLGRYEGSNDKATDAQKVAVFNTLYLNAGTYTVTGNMLATKAMMAKSKFAIGGNGNQYEFAISGNALTLTQKPSGAVLKLTRLE